MSGLAAERRSTYSARGVTLVDFLDHHAAILADGADLPNGRLTVAPKMGSRFGARMRITAGRTLREFVEDRAEH